MFYIGVDPGMTTGMAIMDDSTGKTYGDQDTDPEAVQLWIDSILHQAGGRNGNSVIIVEDFTGGGYRTKEAIHTLKLVGFFYYGNLYRGRNVVLRTNQQRLKGSSFVVNQDHIPEPHAKDALKHIYAYYEDIK
jgi:hypothetical protein